MAQALPVEHGLEVVRAVRLGGETRPRIAPAAWRLSELAGRLTELSGLGDGACLTLAFSVLLDAQQQGEPVAWITLEDSCFHPLDAWASGADLEALPVVRMADTQAIVRAADRLARSGGFGLLVLDLGAGDDKATALGQRPVRVSTAQQARLRSLAHHHGTAILCLTRKPESTASLGSLVSLHARTRRERTESGDYRVHLEAVKDKHRGPGWEHTEVFIGPDGL